MLQEIEFPTIFPVTSHTDHVGIGSTFVAIQGNKENGVAYIPQAIAKGATQIVIEQTVVLPKEIQQLIEEKKITVERVDSARRALAQLSAQALDYPAKKLKLIAITGTKGKTTTTFLIEHILRTAGYKTALMSTVRNIINEQVFPTLLTTSQPDYMHMFFNLCVQAEVDYVVMEVSAQGLTLERVYGLEFDGIIFTNFSQEHAEFYSNLDDYFSAKCLIFDMIKKDCPVLINWDDEWSKKIVTQRAQYYSLKDATASLYGDLIQDNKNGIAIRLKHHDEFLTYYSSSLVGSYNAYNMFAAISLTLELGIDPSSIDQAVQSFSHVPGRMERYQLPNQSLCIIDYAHNPSSFQAILPTLKKMSDNLIVVFGCGGDRDATKRPVMGAIAAELADVIIVTTDNPRSEDPADICKQIIAGIAQEHKHKVIYELDRQQAIKKAYKLSKPNSIIALLGKGPDEYQLVKGVKTYFSEREIVKSLR